MFLSRIFRKRPAEAAGAALYASAARQARDPVFYTAMGAPDTLEGRFELYTLHVILLIDRLSGQGGQASETSQAAFDAYVRGLDDALREIGVGDLSMKKKMKKLAGAFYGRLQAWQEAALALPDTAALEAVLARTTFEGIASGNPKALAAYVANARRSLAAQALEAVLAGEVTWPKP